MKKNEPNSNPICNNRLLSRPKQHTFSQSRKNEPKTNPIYADSNPICEKNTKIYAISNYNFSDFLTKRKLLFTTFRPKNMQNEPNLKNTKINITAVPTKAYMKNDAFSPPKNEPKTNPISNFPLGFNQFMKNMRNEPNFKNAKINVTSFLKMDYGNFRRLQRRKNEPNLRENKPNRKSKTCTCIFAANPYNLRNMFYKAGEY